MLGRTVDAEKMVEHEERLKSFQVSVSQSVRMISARDASAPENRFLESDSMRLSRTKSLAPKLLI